jgi:uncharacterized protein (TIGR03000 family)
MSELMEAQPATLVVSLPADATLTVEDQPTSSTSAERTFQTPVLEHGKAYVYTLKAQIKSDGKVKTLSRQVQVRAGETTQVNLDFATTSVASR